MQSVIFNCVNTGAFVKLVILILFETLYRSTKEMWQIKNAYGVCEHHSLRPVCPSGWFKKSICGSHTLCVDHEESSGTKQLLHKYTTHSEPLIELSYQRKHKEHVYLYFNFKLIGSKK